MAGTKAPAELPAGVPAFTGATLRLIEEFGGVIGAATVERLLRDSYVLLAQQATVAQHLPLLSERFARERLRALARSESAVAHGVPVVLFLCVENANRSQMALGFFRHLAENRAVALSGGSRSGQQVNPLVVEAMAEREIDISEEFPKPWTDETVGAADVVVTMGCGDACPVLPGKRYEEWELDDPAGQDLDGVRMVRDEIERRVHGLLGRLGV